MNGSSERRTQTLINKPLQARIVFSVSKPAMLCLLLAWLLLMAFCVQLGYDAVVADVELPSVVPIGLCVLVMMSASCAVLVHRAFKLSHRIAGPMYRLQKTLEAVRDGDLSARAHLRREDHLVELAESLNGFLDSFERQLTEKQQASGEATAAPAPVPAALARTGEPS